MNRRLLLLIALCSSTAFAQLKPAPGFQPKTPQQTQQQQPTSAPAATKSTPAAPVATPTANPTGGYDLAVSAEKQWTDTGIDVNAGDKISFSSDGTIQFGGALASTADGLTRGWRDLMRALPVNSAGNGALIGRIGPADFSTPFLIGKSKDVVAPIDGRLYLGINQLANESSNGSYAVKLAIAKAAAAATADTATATPKANVSLDLLKPIPRRVEDQLGNKGDIVNFVILGDKDKLENAFQSAGWVLVDKTTGAAVVNALFSSLDKRAYVQMPMSTLFLFGRSQDYGYAHAEPISVVASRHHLRIWKSEETFEGRPVYVGSCTHDIGFERDQRNNGVTHKIDPNIDLERDYLKETLTSTGLVSSSTYLEPNDAVKDAKTATGGTINTDGRVLVLILR